MRKWASTLLLGLLLGSGISLVWVPTAQGPLTNAANLRVRTDENGYLLLTTAAVTGTDGPLTAFGNIRLRTDSSGYLLTTLSSTSAVSVSTLAASTAALTSPAVTIGSGTGVTVNDAGSVRQEVYKVTVSYTNAVTNGVTHDLTIATLPAKTFLTHLLADVTTPFVCADTCTTATISGTVGSSAGGTQYLESFDLDAAAAQFGDAGAELGASLIEASIPTTVGALGSWASTQIVSYRITSGTGAVATAGVTNFNAGSVTFYLTTIKYP